MKHSTAELNTLWNSLIERFKNLNLDPNEVYVGHSGGKDSCLVHRLCLDAGYDFTLIHTSKTPNMKNGIHPLTLDFIYMLSTQYPITFCPLSSLKGLVRTTQIDGTRSDEAERNDGRSTDLVIGGKDVDRREMTLLNGDGLEGKKYVYPLFDVSTDTVWALISHLGVEVSPEYLETEN
jgi:3'-phosphoadenosine 5'-phosphosulfate sulfotransferase (PAPS reductase)/FAD synthetase